MGLDFSHTDAHWSYGGFGRFRLAAVVGIDLPRMAGFERGSALAGRPWSTVQSSEQEPIIDLLDHSDCDGELTAEQCARIAPRLRELVAHWPEDDYDRRHAELLADGMDLAAEAGESLEFV